jgi:hypothetical protein
MAIATFKYSVNFGIPPLPDRQLWIIDATAAARSGPLPDATLCFGVEITVIKADSSANAVTVNRSGSQTILGTAGAALTSVALAAQGNSVTLVSDGANWLIKSAT